MIDKLSKLGSVVGLLFLNIYSVLYLVREVYQVFVRKAFKGHFHGNGMVFIFYKIIERMRGCNGILFTWMVYEDVIGFTDEDAAQSLDMF